MKCTTCGLPLSLRMTRCSTCGTPAPYITMTSQQASHAPSKGRNSVQLFPHQQNSTVSPPVSTTPTPIQREISTHFEPSQAYPFSPPPSYDSMQTSLIKKGYRRNFFLLAIIGCVLLLFAISGYKLVQIANATDTGKQANTPSGNAFVPAASIILKDAQTSSAIDNTLAATQTTQSFIANQQVYVTFTITSGKQDGSIEAKWYANGQVVAITILPHQHENTHGVFSNVYITATPDGAVELYWCTQSDCRDAQLAQVVHFVVMPINTAYYESLKRKQILFKGTL